MLHRARNLFVAAATITVLAGASTAIAGVAGSPTTNHPVLPNVNGWAGWNVNNGGAPFAITYDAIAAPWTQTLLGSGGSPLPGINEGKTYALQQIITPTGDDEWFGWLSSINEAGWQWVTGSAPYADPVITLDNLATPGVENNPLPGLSFVVTPTTQSVGGSLTFSFDPQNIPANTSLRISGFIRYVGIDPESTERFTGGAVTINSIPLIPTPGFGALLALTGLVVLRRSRSQNDLLELE